jgi:hypothetical protein
MMWWRLSAILLALAFQTSFPANTTETLRQRYGQPVSETFLVRPDIVVTVTHGTSGNICELVISPRSKEPHAMPIRWPGSDTIDYGTLKEVENELVPISERGEFVIGGFIDGICMPENDCMGEQDEWEKVVIYSNAGKGGARYGVIQWQRQECPP